MKTNNLRQDLDSMQLFAVHIITLPDFIPCEADFINRLLDRGDILIWMHLRKPGCSEADMRSLIEAVNPCHRRSLVLHDHLDLAVEFKLGGVQLNSRNDHVPDGFNGVVMRSCHTPDEIDRYADQCDYLMLSPAFDSLSKQGYSGRYGSYDTTECVRRHPGKVIALGGVTPNRFTALRRLGYAGVALLGFVWNDSADIDSALRQIVCATFGYLQYITHGNSARQICRAVERVVEGGCQWVQLRHKGDVTSELRRYAVELSTGIGPEQGVTTIINDRIELAWECGAEGVHLGKLDRSPAEARIDLGPQALIGATANTFEDIERAVSAGADYIGLGPFRYTDTKQNLSPILGLDGYRDIMQRCRQAGITLPVVAIGGITMDDVPDLMATGINGIAVSGLLTKGPKPTLTTFQLISKILRN